MRISRHAVDAALAPSEWITGDARIETLAVSPGPHAAIATVTFAPGARTVWHRHRSGRRSSSPPAPAALRAAVERSRRSGPATPYTSTPANGTGTAPHPHSP